MSPSGAVSGRGPSIATLRRFLLFLMNAAAFLSLYLSGEVSPLAGGLFAGALGVGWFWQAPRVNFARWQTPWTVATLVAFALTIFQMLNGSGFALTSAMYFLVFLAGAKLFQLAEHKDFTQSMALSLVLLASGSVLNDQLSFGVMFMVYVLASTLGLTTQHLTIEVSERNGDVRRTRMERAIFWSTLVLAICVFLGAVGFFFAFPRIGFGFFVQQNRGGVNASGFNDEVELGNHGNIREDARIVMRVRFPEGSPPPLYFRGLSLNEYTGVAWLDHDNRDEHRLTDHDEEGGGFRIGDAVDMTWDEATNGAIVSDVYLEPLNSDVLFAPGRFYALGLPDDVTDLPESWFGRTLRADASGEVSLAQRSSQGIMYRAWSRVNAPTLEELQAARYPLDAMSLPEALHAAYTEGTGGPPTDENGRPLTAEDRWFEDLEMLNRVASSGSQGAGELVELARLYLRLPEDQITPRMAALVEELRSAGPTDVDFAVALQSRLREMEYTTDLPRPSGPDANLVDEFVFEWQRGHCEYYATAMVVLLRAGGVPARIVNGFLGADYNSVGGFYAVRQANAHSWVEAYFPGEGWVRFDPTPGGAVDMSGEGFMRRVSEFIDNLRLSWFRWVVEYDLEKQVSLVRDAVDALRSNDDDSEESQLAGDFSDWVRQAMRWVWRRAAALVLLGFLWFAAAATYQRRASHRLPWGGVDWGVTAGWAALAVGVIFRLWPDEAALSGALAALLPVAFTAFIAKELRDDLFDVGDGRKGRSRGTDVLSHLYARFVRAVEREVGDLPLSVTAAELLDELDLQDREAAAQVAEFVDAYQRVRFAGATLSEEEEREWRRRYRAMQRAVTRDLRRQMRDDVPPLD